jgi:hypothetical protein
VTRAPWSNAATSKEQRVRVESFSKMSAMFLPVSFCTSLPFFIGFELCGKGQQRSELCRGKVEQFQKVFLVQIGHFILAWRTPLIELKFTLYV